MEFVFPSTATLGLTVLVLGWIAQIYHVIKKDTKLSPYFLLAQAVGCIILGLNRSTMSELSPTVLNLAAAAFAVILLLALYKKKK